MISIITPYSKEYQHFLPECKETVQAQTYKDFEHIFWEYNDKPFNLGRARNQAIRTASGEYIVCLDIDDKLDPTYLERTIELATSNTIVTTGLKCFGETSWEMTWPEGEFSFEHFKRRNRAHCASLYPKRVWEELGGYDERFKAYEDWDFWTRAAKIGTQFRSIQDKLFFYRQHQNQMTKNIPSGIMDLFINKHFPKPLDEDVYPFRASDPYL